MVRIPRDSEEFPEFLRRFHANRMMNDSSKLVRFHQREYSYVSLFCDFPVSHSLHRTFTHMFNEVAHFSCFIFWEFFPFCCFLFHLFLCSFVSLFVSRVSYHVPSRLMHVFHANSCIDFCVEWILREYKRLICLRYPLRTRVEKQLLMGREPSAYSSVYRLW